MHRIGTLMRHGPAAPWPTRRRSVLIALLLSIPALPVGLTAADYDAAREAYLTGDYSNALQQAEAVVMDRVVREEWHELLIESLLAVGRYPEANKAATNALDQHPGSLPLRWLSRETLLSVGETEAAELRVREIAMRAVAQQRFVRTERDRVTAGRALLLEGVDPKQVLDKLYTPAKENEPDLRDVYLAAGELALEKNDYELAAGWFRDGLRQLPDDADLQFGLAQAYAPSEPVLATRALEAALERNSNHVDSLLMLVDRKVDAEAYEDADRLVDTVLRVNPAHPEAWAFRAVIAHLQNQPALEEEARAKALEFWPTNPRVDHLMGLKLSQKYRFKEGAEHQVQALLFDANHQPSMLQLSLDLLRLGRDTEGWQLAERVHQTDEYNVTANNLVALRDVLEGFHTLTNDNFLLRMTAGEAPVYGGRALDLLERARVDLCEKYALDSADPTTVEVFDRQSDFAVRTFGMPENHGFLGVCFGSVITANSPAAHPGRGFNWEAMLWHEYCHVVTLRMTRNRIPRWLSEGISVYEERQANPTWGEQMTPDYREMLLSPELTPVSELSSSFMNPRSAEHLQFAYYHSSLVVELLIDRYGREKLITLLHELGEGTTINEALEKHVAPISEIESAFQEFAEQTAHAFGPELDWERPFSELLTGTPHSTAEASTSTDSTLEVLTDDPAAAWEEWAAERPANFWVMMRTARDHIRAEEWEEAVPLLEELVEKAPDAIGTPSAYTLLADAHRALDNPEAERRVLMEFVEREDEALTAFERLIDLVTPQGDWPSVIDYAERSLAVNPLTAAPYRHLARATEAEGRTAEAIEAYRVLLQLDPVNPALLHYRLARLLHATGDPSARRHVLQALEEAPRYRAALDLLLKINSETRTESRTDDGEGET